MAKTYELQLTGKIFVIIYFHTRVGDYNAADIIIQVFGYKDKQCSKSNNSAQYWKRHEKFIEDARCCVHPVYAEPVKNNSE